MPKISAKFDRDHPLRGHQMQMGWVKIGDFRQITGYISKTVPDRRMVSIKVESGWFGYKSFLRPILQCVLRTFWYLYK